MDDKYGRTLRSEPDWVKGDLGKYFRRDGAPTIAAKKEDEPVQQSDLLKPLFMDIFKYGLNYAFKGYQKDTTTSKTSDEDYKCSMTTNRKHVIIVGAGQAGLVAAYELAQVGHRVTVLEETTRTGGRVYTLGESEGLDKGLHGEAGAMRLPGKPTVAVEDMTHFLTAAYINKFGLENVDFVNTSENGFFKFYNEPVVRAKDWKDSCFSQLWPGWDDTIKDNKVDGICNIDEYYSRTTKIVTDQLRKWLTEAAESDVSTEAGAWDRWINIWSQFSLDGFLQSSYEAVMTKVPESDQTGLEKLKKLLPWPEEAVRAYSIFSYTEQLDQSLVQYLRDQLGMWWSPNMHRIKDGMSLLHEAFTKPNENGWNKNVHIYKEIHFNRRVNEIVYQYDAANPDNNKVQIKGYYTSSKRPFPIVEGDAVIVTTPVNILRQITFTPSPNTSTPSPPTDFYKAIEDIFTGPSTKIFIQTKSRFWEAENGIYGGFSKTNLPIGQIHYPSNLDGNLAGTDKGLLLIYTWKSEALLFGSLSPDVALREAVEQIATIHPEITAEFELGIVHAWHNQPWAQGAYGLLKPNQFKNVKWLWMPMCNVFFAGEALSTATGWIQGALESGLKAAYQFYVRNEPGSCDCCK